MSRRIRNEAWRANAPLVANLERRLFLKRGLSLGALTLLTGCTGTSESAVDKLLWMMSRWNDRVQAAIFDPDRLAPTYTEAELTTPFPFNAYYPVARVPRVV